MLSYMRKHSKGWLVKFILGAIIVVFILWGGSSYMNKEENKIAKVDNHIISKQQYQKAYTDTINSYQQQYGQLFNDKMIKMLGLKRKVLNQMIENYILEQEAKELNLGITDEDLQDALLKVPFFLSNGAFDRDKYDRFLNYMKMSPQQFEEQQRRNIIREKLYSIITGNAIVTEDDIHGAYRQREDAYELNFIKIDADKFQNSIKPTEEDILAYYTANKDSYKIPPQIRIAYIEFDASKNATGIAVPENKIRDYYEARKNDFTTPAKVHARHILIAVPQDATEEVQKEKKDLAEKISEKLKAGEKFSTLAKKYSDDKSSASKGGDWGWITQENLDETLAKTIFAMKPGDTQGPMRTQAGYQIFKVDEKVEQAVTPFEKVSAEIVQKLKMRQAKEMAYREVDSAFRELFESSKQDIVAFAKQKGLTLSEYGPFGEHDQIAIPMKPEAKSTAFTLQEGDLGGPIDIGTGYLFYRVTSKIPARIPELKEVRDKVVQGLRKANTLKAAKEYAINLAEKSKPEDLAAMSPESTGSFKRSAWSIPKMAGAMQVKRDLDALHKPKFYDVGGELYIVWLKSYTPAKIEDLKKRQYNALYNELIKKKKEQLFQSFVEEAKKRHKIVIATDKLT